MIYHVYILTCDALSPRAAGAEVMGEARGACTTRAAGVVRVFCVEKSPSAAVVCGVSRQAREGRGRVGGGQVVGGGYQREATTCVTSLKLSVSPSRTGSPSSVERGSSVRASCVCAPKGVEGSGRASSSCEMAVCMQRNPAAVGVGTGSSSRLAASSRATYL